MPLAIAPFTPASLSMPVPPVVLADGLPTSLFQRRVSPLVIADQLITLAEHADRAGLQATASKLVKLMFTVLDERGVPN